MAGEFSGSVDYGLELSKRIYYGKDMIPVAAAMSKSENYLPTAVMVYAVVAEPGMVDNPDVPSYQPYVHGRCEPPALVPLHMYGSVEMEVKCSLDYAAVTLNATWRLNSVVTTSSCDCCVAIPLPDKANSVLQSVELDVDDGRSYHSQFLTKDHDSIIINQTQEDGRFLKPHIYTFKIPQVQGGSNISLKLNCSHKLSYHNAHFCLTLPFTFPPYVNPVGNNISKREKIMLTVNSGIAKQILCANITHPLKELTREVGKLSFLYEAQVLTWSNSDLSFSFSLPSTELFGGVLLQSPPMHDFDQRQMFCLYLFPGTGSDQSRKVFRKEVVFMLDISGSMKGAPLDNAKSAILASLSNFTPQDSFNIIAFNGETSLFSPTMKLATEDSILNATQWLASEVIAGGGTDIFTPFKQAMKLLSDTSDSVPLILLITDGAVEDEREICNFAKEQLTTNRSSISPRICTFGIGLHCNSYFLKMLAQIGSGHFDYAYDAGSVDFQLQRFFTVVSSVTLANISVSSLEQLDSLEIYPSQIPDLSSEHPLFLSGRYKGEFPDLVTVRATLPDMTSFQIDLKAQNAKDVPLDKVFAKRQIDILTALAWLSESKEIENKVAKMSIQTGTPSEYTPMILHLTNEGKKLLLGPSLTQKVFNSMNLIKAELGYRKIILLGNLGIGFGNLAATTKNTPAGVEHVMSSNTLLVRATSSLYGNIVDHCCCMCCLRCLSHTSDRLTIWLTQFCAALACCECMDCCFELCECLG